MEQMNAEQFEIEMGKTLQKLREKKGKTQAEVADELGLNSRETVKQWESWDRHIKAGDLIKLSRYYGVSVDNLLGLTDEPKLTPSISAAASYLGLTDYETKRLHDLLQTAVYRLLFQKLLRGAELRELLKKIDAVRAEVRCLEKKLDADNAADVAKKEARHIQRDLSEDLEGLLSGITGVSMLKAKIDMLIEAQKQEQAFEDYVEQMKDLALYSQEAQHGEHQKD